MSNVDRVLSQAQTLFSIGDFDKAELICNRLLNKNIHSPRIYNLLGLIKRKHGNVEGAIRKWADGSMLFPDNPTLHFNIGAVLTGHNSHKREVQARDHLQTAVRLQPNWVSAIFLLGISYGRLGNTEEAAAR